MYFSMHFSMEKCITFELDFIRSKMTGWKVRKKKFAFFWVRHQNFLTLLFCSTCPISGKPPPGTGCPVKFIGFIGTLKFERVTPSNAFKKTHRQNSREMTSDARVTVPCVCVCMCADTCHMPCSCMLTHAHMRPRARTHTLLMSV